MGQMLLTTFDPANRLVVGELERRYESALEALEEMESKAKARMEIQDRPLKEDEQQALKSYAAQLPRLWHAPTTQAQERKRIVRCLVEAVIVTAPQDASFLKTEVHWVGGQVTTIEVQRGRRGVNRYLRSEEHT